MDRPDSDDEPSTRYDYERGSLPARDGMSQERTPIRGLVSIFSENKKQGRWELPRHMRVLAIFGSAEVDPREAVIGPGVSVIEALTIFGNIEIIVPPEINVECDGDAPFSASSRCAAASADRPRFQRHWARRWSR